MLGQNQISILKPDMFAGMRNLSDLDLPLNALTILPSNTFKPLIVLKVLDLSLNRIQRISPKAFTGLRQLLFLNLDNNRLFQYNKNKMITVMIILATGIYISRSYCISRFQSEDRSSRDIRATGFSGDAGSRQQLFVHTELVNTERP